MFDSDTSLQSSITDQKVVSKLQLKKPTSPLLVISYSKSSQLFLIFFFGGGGVGVFQHLQCFLPLFCFSLSLLNSSSAILVILLIR